MTGTVTAEYLTYAGAPAKGTVTFGTNTTDQQLRNPAGDVVYTGPRKYRLVSGALEVDLPGTDDVAFAETGWQYWARIELDGAPPALRWFELPDGDTVDLADIAGELAPGDPLTHPVSQADLDALIAAIDGIEVAAPPAAPPDPQHQSVILFGTSLEELNGTGVEGPLNVGVLNSPAGIGWANWAYAYLDHQFYTAVNAGVGGNRYDQMLARIGTDVMAYDSEWVWMGGPVNDITNARTFNQIKADMDSMLATILADGRRVLILNATASTTVDSAPERAVLASVNDYIATLPGLFPGRVVVADAFTEISDPTTIQPLANATFDGTHYSDVGANLIGRRAAEAVRSITPPPVAGETTAMGRPALTQILPNPFLTNTGWTVSELGSGATTAASWAVPGRVSLTYAGYAAENSDGYGVSLTSPLTTGFAPGDFVRVKARAKWKQFVPVSVASMPGPVARLQARDDDDGFTDPTLTNISTAGGNTEIPDRFPNSGEVTVLTPWLELGPDVDRLYIRLFFTGMASVWVEFSDFEVLRKAP